MVAVGALAPSWLAAPDAAAVRDPLTVPPCSLTQRLSRWTQPAQQAMSGLLQALANMLGVEHTPGTPEHREALFRSIKERNDELAKPLGQRDQARLLEPSKRVLRLRIQACQVSRRENAAGRLRLRLACPGGVGVGVAAPRGLLAAPCRGTSHTICCQAHQPQWRRCNLQAKKQEFRRNEEFLLQHPDLGCCSDCVRVRQRAAATSQAMAAWNEAWQLISTRRLQALEQGQPYPPLTLPYLELHLPEGLPEDLPPSIDRCATCQKELDEDEVRLRAVWGRLQGCRPAEAPAAALLCCTCSCSQPSMIHTHTKNHCAACRRNRRSPCHRSTLSWSGAPVR